MVEENIETNIYYLIGYALSAMESARDSLHTSQSNDKIFSRLNDAVDYIKKGIKKTINFLCEPYIKLQVYSFLTIASIYFCEVKYDIRRISTNCYRIRRIEANFKMPNHLNVEKELRPRQYKIKQHKK